MRSFSKIRAQKWLEKNVPHSLKKVSRGLGTTRLFRSLFLNKYESEMACKLEWGEALEDPKILDRARHYWETYRFLNEITEMIGLNDHSRVLDVGCGIATVLHFVPGKEKIGVDPLARWYTEAYAYPPSMQILPSEGEVLRFPGAHFDATFCSNVLDHVTDHMQVLSEIRRVTKDQGHFVLTVEIHPGAHDHARDPHHPHTFSKEAVHDMLDRTGWKILFERETPFLGVKQYALQEETKDDIEVVIVAIKA